MTFDRVDSGLLRSKLNAHEVWVQGDGGDKATFQRVDLSDVFIPHHTLDRIEITASLLRRVNLFRSSLKGANLSYVDLTGATLERADLTGANLEHSCLSRAHLQYANLAGANLASADLSHADLRYADLTGADVDLAKLSTANLHGSKGLLGLSTKAFLPVFSSVAMSYEDDSQVIRIDDRSMSVADWEAWFKDSNPREGFLPLIPGTAEHKQAYAAFVGSVPTSTLYDLHADMVELVDRARSNRAAP